MPLHTFLVRLIWLSLLPLLLLASWLAYDNASTQAEQQKAEAMRLTQNLATSIDQHLQSHIGGLNMLATSPLLDDPAHWPALYGEAQGFQKSFGSHVILASTGEPMQMLFNTRSPFGTRLPELPQPRGHAAARSALDTLRPAVGDIVLGPVTNTPLVAIAVPALRNGKPTYLLIGVIEIRRFQESMDRLPLPASWAISLQDSRNDIIAERAPAGFVAMRDVDPEYRFTAPSSLSSWSVVLDIPRNTYRKPLLDAAMTFGLGLLAATLIGAWSALSAARRLGRAVDALVEGAGNTEPQAEIAEINGARLRIEAAQAALTDSETRFQAIFDGMVDAVVFTDTSRRIRLVNPAFTRLFGYSADEVMGRTPGFLYTNPADHASLEVQTQGSDRDPKIDSREISFRHKSGREFWAETSVSRILDQSGKPLGYIGMHHDISQRRQLEARLRLWGEAFDHGQTCLAISDARANTLVAVNPAFARLRGYTPEELQGQPVALLFPAELRETARQRIAEIDRNLHGQFESEHLRKDGSRFPVMLDVTVIRDSDGWPINRIAFAMDLTERRQTEQALAAIQASEMERQRQARLAVLNQMQDSNTARQRAENALAALNESREQLRLFIEHAPAALAMFDRDMRYLAVSRRWMEDYALGIQSLIGRCHYDIFPEIPNPWRQAHQRGMAGEIIRADGERFLRSDGSEHWIRWEIRPWRAATGTVGGIVIFSEDITRQKAADEEIRQLNTNLEQRVNERTAELSAANRELDSFAYAVSHDLRAPLRAMNGFSQAMIEDCAPQLNSEAKGYLDQIVLAAHRMNTLIDGLLALSRSTRGELERDVIDISALAGQQLASLQRDEPTRSVNWQVEPNLIGRGDRRMIEAALQNLLANAWKYTAGKTPAEIRVYAGQCGQTCGFCIADNGAGFDMAHAERLFKPFQRLHRQDEFPGIGIGLATVQRIISRHGGELSAHAEAGKGALFCFTLPDMTPPDSGDPT
ncbi:MAG: PAS domain S-box protein [Betaproteobacteria bacterium]|nr:PAS domain S-box protein [Betaproteobacteria bacterium]